jgi:transcription antitermination factor NusG
MDEKELESVEIPTLRLELARIQDQQEGGEASDFVMGPLVKLSFVRNSLLEHIADCIRSNGLFIQQDGPPVQASALLSFGVTKKRSRNELRNNPAIASSASSLVEQSIEDMPLIDVGSFVQVIAGKHRGQIGRFVHTGSSRNEETLQVEFFQTSGTWLTLEILRKNVYQISDADAIVYAKSIGLDDSAIGDPEKQQQLSKQHFSRPTADDNGDDDGSGKNGGSAAAEEADAEATAAAAAADDDNTSEFSIPNSQKKFTKNDRVRVSSTSYEGKGTFVRYVDTNKAQVYVQNSSDTEEGSEGRLLTLHVKKLKKLHPDEDIGIFSKTSKKTRPREIVESSSTGASLTALGGESSDHQEVKATHVDTLKNKSFKSGDDENDDGDVKRWLINVHST